MTVWQGGLHLLGEIPFDRCFPMMVLQTEFLRIRSLGALFLPETVL